MSVVDWLIVPLSGAPSHHLEPWAYWHARCMVLGGADVLIYPTAIGSEPSYPGWDSRDHWQRVMQGHAGAISVQDAGNHPRRLGFGFDRL